MSVACKVWRVSFECKAKCGVWSVKCGVQSAQCRGKFKGPPSALEWTFLEPREEVTQRAAKVQDDR